MRAWCALGAVLSACVGEIPITAKEACATEGFAVNAFSMTLNGKHTSFDETVTCRAPIGSAEQCEVRADAASELIKDGWSALWRNVVIEISYDLVLVPGLVASSVFIKSEHATEVAAKTARRAVLRECMAAIPPSVPASGGSDTDGSDQIAPGAR